MRAEAERAPVTDGIWKRSVILAKGDWKVNYWASFYQTYGVHAGLLPVTRNPTADHAHAEAYWNAGEVVRGARRGRDRAPRRVRVADYRSGPPKDIFPNALVASQAHVRTDRACPIERLCRGLLILHGRGGHEE